MAFNMYFTNVANQSLCLNSSQIQIQIGQDQKGSKNYIFGAKIVAFNTKQQQRAEKTVQLPGRAFKAL